MVICPICKAQVDKSQPVCGNCGEWLIESNMITIGDILRDDDSSKIYFSIIFQIKQFIKDRKLCLFYDFPMIMDKYFGKKDRGEELSLDDMLSHIEELTGYDFIESILNEDSFILSEDNRCEAENLQDWHDEKGVYLLYETYYVMKFIGESPEIINRAINIRQIFYKQRPSQRVRNLCKDAYSSYISGFYNASATLLRSIIETVLLEKLKMERCDFWILNKVGKKFGLYGKDIFDKIDHIRDGVNKLLHNLYREGISESDNRVMIEYSQDILNYLLNRDVKIFVDNPGIIQEFIIKCRDEHKKKNSQRKRKFPKTY